MMVRDDLVNQVIAHLAGRDVAVRWERPPARHGMGQACKLESGQAVIFVAPTGDLGTRFKVFLHELAHIRHDWAWMPVYTGEIQPDQVVVSDTTRQAWRADPREERANAQAAEWWDFAEKNAGECARWGDSPMEGRLRALLNWQPTEGR